MIIYSNQIFNLKWKEKRIHLVYCTNYNQRFACVEVVLLLHIRSLPSFICIEEEKWQAFAFTRPIREYPSIILSCKKKQKERSERKKRDNEWAVFFNTILLDFAPFPSVTIQLHVICCVNLYRSVIYINHNDVLKEIKDMIYNEKKKFCWFIEKVKFRKRSQSTKWTKSVVCDEQHELKSITFTILWQSVHNKQKKRIIGNHKIILKWKYVDDVFYLY